MSNILKGLNEGRSYGRDSWDSNMPGYQGDYGGAENFGRRNREWDEDDRIDARLRAQHAQKQEYEKNGKFWLKFKDSQRHLPAGPFIGKQAANTAAVELLKQQPELKGNLLITAYGPDETQGVAEGKVGADPYDRGYHDGQRMGSNSYHNPYSREDEPTEWDEYKSGFNMAQIELQNDLEDNGFSEGVAEGQLDELSNNTLASYKKKAGADATQADKRGDYARGNKRMSGIIKATKKEFDNDAKGVNEEELDENLNKWFKEKWVRFGPDGKIRGDCARGDDSEGKPKCLPQSKAQNLGKEGRASAASRKRREDPNPERSGKAINVNTKKKSNERVAEGSLNEDKGFDVVKSLVSAFNNSVSGDANIPLAAERPGSRVFTRSDGTRYRDHGNIRFYQGYIDPQDVDKWKATNPVEKFSDWLTSQPGVKPIGQVSGEFRSDAMRDAVAYKGLYFVLTPHGSVIWGSVSRFKNPNSVWRQQGPKQGVAEEQLDEKCWDTHKQVGMKNKGGKQVPNCVPKESIEESRESCPECGGPMFSDMLLAEKQDACYNKVKSRYKVWPSAYASGALVQCRKKGADNWGTGGKKSESAIMRGLVDENRQGDK